MARILIVDDEELVRLTLRQALEKERHELVDATNGEEALRLLRRRAVDLVITDIIMPEKEGIETIREIRQDYPETKIIAISGGGRMGNVDFLRMSQLLGADAILPKPFGPEELLKLVRRILAPEDQDDGGSQPLDARSSGEAD